MKKNGDSILHWSYVININLNLSKFQYISFNIKSRLNPVLGQWLLEQSRTVEDLGITMSDSLSWRENEELGIRKVNKFFLQSKKKHIISLDGYCKTKSL